MKNMQKVLAISCIACLAGTAAGCGNSNPSADGNGQGASGEPAPVMFDFFFSLGIPEYPQDGGPAKKVIQEQLEKAGIPGIDYKINMLGGSEYQTKLNLLASSGELPDFFSIDTTTLAQFVDQGLVMPLDDHLAKSPSIMEVVPKERWEGVTFDGKIYAIPYGVREETFNSPNTSGLLVRQDWLDNVGMEQPTTIDELYEVLKAFTFNDPDKNGQNDTYGLGGYKDSRFSSVFGSFGISPTYWHEKDGKIVKGFVLPAAKEALAILQKWYKEGLIDPEFPVMESKQRESKVINSKIGAFEDAAFSVDPTGSGLPEALVKATPSAELVMLVPPKGPEGKQGMPEANPYAGGGLKAVSTKAQEPERLFQFLDWSVREDDNGGVNLLTYGIEGEDYTFDREKNKITQTSSYNELYKKGFSNPVRLIQVTDRRWTEERVREALDISATYLINNELWKTVPAELDYPDLEKKLWAEYFVKIVTGTWSIDKFDEFVEKYYQQGGKVIEEQANEVWKELK